MSPRQARKFDVFPAVVAYDSREQLPYAFDGFTVGGRDRRRPLVIRKQRVALTSGDYSLVGCEDRIAIERKSHEDAYNTFIRDRDRFLRELERLAELEFAAVVIEADWTELLEPPFLSQVTPASILGSILAWQLQFGVHFMCVPGRRFAEKVTFQLLRRFYQHHHSPPKTKENTT